jgi:hypothetical protein
MPHSFEKLGLNFGDIVLKYDGLTPKQYAERYKWITGGANPSASFRKAVEHMSSRDGRYYEPPVRDAVKLELLNYITRRPYNFTIDWWSFRDLQCLAHSRSAVSPGANNTFTPKIKDKEPDNIKASKDGKSDHVKSSKDGKLDDVKPSKDEESDNLLLEESFYGPPWKKHPSYGKIFCISKMNPS